MATIMNEGTDGSPGGQDLYFHLRQRAVTPESKTLFAATGRISRVITSNPVIRRFESRLAQSSMAFANMSLSKSEGEKHRNFIGIMSFTRASELAANTLTPYSSVSQPGCRRQWVGVLGQITEQINKKIQKYSEEFQISLKIKKINEICTPSDTTTGLLLLLLLLYYWLGVSASKDHHQANIYKKEPNNAGARSTKTHLHF